MQASGFVFSCFQRRSLTTWRLCQTLWTNYLNKFRSLSYLRWVRTKLSMFISVNRETFRKEEFTGMQPDVTNVFAPFQLLSLLLEALLCPDEGVQLSTLSCLQPVFVEPPPAVIQQLEALFSRLLTLTSSPSMVSITSYVVHEHVQQLIQRGYFCVSTLKYNKLF